MSENTSQNSVMGHTEASRSTAGTAFDMSRLGKPTMVQLGQQHYPHMTLTETESNDEHTAYVWRTGQTTLLEELDEQHVRIELPGHLMEGFIKLHAEEDGPDLGAYPAELYLVDTSAASAESANGSRSGSGSPRSFPLYHLAGVRAAVAPQRLLDPEPQSEIENDGTPLVSLNLQDADGTSALTNVPAYNQPGRSVMRVPGGNDHLILNYDEWQSREDQVTHDLSDVTVIMITVSGVDKVGSQNQSEDAEMADVEW